MKLTLKETRSVAGLFPVTASLIFSRSELYDIDLKKGGIQLPRQLDVLSRHDDGSINHALCSFVFQTDGEPGRQHYVDIVGGHGIQAYGLPIPNINFDDLALQVTLVDSSGRTWMSEVPPKMGWEIVRLAISTQSLSPHIMGPLVREIEYPIELRSLNERHPNLYVIARWRLHQKGPARIEVVVENSAYPKMADVKVSALSVKMAGRDFNITVPDGTFYAGQRFRVTHWVGDNPDLIIRQDPKYLRKIGIIPLLNLEAPLSTDEVRKTNSGYLDYINLWAPNGLPFTSTPILRKMGTTGDRDDIGAFPEWGMVAVNSLEKGAQDLLFIADTNGAGAFPVHLRDPKTKNMGLTRDNQITHAKGGTKCPNDPDRAHQPCLAYISYILTGERYFEEELCAWASYNTREWPWTVELKYPGGRDSAWSLRSVVHAARILPDKNPLKPYFANTVRENLRIWKDRYIINGQQYLLHTWKEGEWSESGRPNWPCAKHISPWQFAFHTWSLYNCWRVLGLSEAFDLLKWSAFYFQQGYVHQLGAEFTSRDGQVIKWDPLYTDQYSFPASVYTPAINEKGKWTEVQGSTRMLSNLAECLWYLHVNESNAWTSGQMPAFPPAGAQPENWLPKPPTYRESQSTFEEYAMGELAPALVVAGIAEAEKIWAFIQPFVKDKKIPGLQHVPVMD